MSVKHCWESTALWCTIFYWALVVFFFFLFKPGVTEDWATVVVNNCPNLFRLVEIYGTAMMGGLLFTQHMPLTNFKLPLQNDKSQPQGKLFWLYLALLAWYFECIYYISDPLAFIIMSFDHILLDQDLKTNFRGFPLVDVFVFAKWWKADGMLLSSTRAKALCAEGHWNSTSLLNNSSLTGRQCEVL